MVSPTASPAPLELGEFQLYNGATRLDAAATLTSNVAPTSGTIASLKDAVTTAGAYWADLTVSGYVILTWAFPTAVEVDGVLLGARTTIARFPTFGLIQGGDAATGVNWPTVRGFGGLKFVSAAMTPIIPLSNPALTPRPIVTQADYSTEGGRGLITDTVKTKATPANIPTHCKVRLLRDIDDKVIREEWTDPVTGVYTFDYFDEHFTYSVKATHPTGAKRAVIADRLTPGLMP
ncbi:hypothetical protein POHY109586_02120 [Polaromonas hydrogenivorans]